MNKPTHVYFIKPVGLAGPIKIGCSWHPKERLEALMAWSPYPLEIVVTVSGGYTLEHNIHCCFADLHSHREWFHPGRNLLEAIELLKKGIPVEQAINLNNRVGRLVKGKCGGASWDAVTRQKMSVLTRVRHALKKIGVDNQYMAPPAIKALMNISEKRILSAQELESIKSFSENPHPYAEACLAEYLPWKQMQDEFRARSAKRKAAA